MPSTDLIVEAIGMTAAFCTTVAFIPQAIMVYRTKDTRSISLNMFLVLTGGLVCWIIYGIYLWQMPIILANVFTLLLASYILIMKLRQQNNQ
jgi:MtN3 and saliva related transmembrane protein